jgi:preprotein translocase subunit YajC
MNAFDLMTLAQGGTTATGSAAGSAPATAPITTTGIPGGTPAAPPAQNPSMMPLMLPLVGLVVVMMVMQVMSGRKEKKKREELMRSIKRGDRVLTIGGIIGTIDQVRDDEVVLKVDPNSNAKISFTRPSIQQVLSSSGTAAEGSGAVEVKTKNEKAAVVR